MTSNVLAIQSATTSIQAQHAESVVCQGVLANFNSATASVAEMKTYAGCVELMYPTQFGVEYALELKLLFVLAIVGMILGIIKGRNDFKGDFEMCAMGAMGGCIGFILLPSTAIFVGFLAHGLKWLFS